ncbi:tetratricopeptide repeat protein [Sandaracinus amylolyticus]|uniref:Uncharacterized protein n=1 Tax=Sandaracinus amylolyticus TaxID=927083 RepID=A0A0F6SHR5_9BACT|nr:tetratricopeptide repeat protein [Sandaracinus amylolyticus]AKF10904.1 hypothetical protein DB32_008053 [Sandaracinus amylolyticus]
MRSFRSWWLASWLVTSAAWAGVGIHVDVAQAQASTDDEARRHFRLGQAHYENGSFLEAAREFEQAYQLSQRPQLLYNVYVAYRDAGDLVRSRDALREYLTRVPDAENAAMLRARLESLDRMVEQQGTTATPTEAPAETTPTEIAPVETRAETTPDASLETAPDPSSGEGGGISPFPFVVAGVGAAMMIGGAITGAMALSSQDTLDATCPDRACPPGYDFESEANDGRALALTTDVLLIGGGVVLAGGLVWLVIDLVSGGSSSSSEQPPVTAMCGPDGCSVAAHLEL